MVYDLQELAAESPDAILSVSGDGILLYANRAAADIVACWQTGVGLPVPGDWRRRTREVLDSHRQLAVQSRVAERIVLFTAVPEPEHGHVNLYCRDITDFSKTAEALQFRLELEDHITRISTELINLGPDEMDSAIDRALADISELACTDRSYVFQYSATGNTMSNTHEFCRLGVPPFRQALQSIPAERFPWFQKQISRHQAVVIDSVDELESEAAAEKQEFQRESIQSLLCVPMICKGRIIGFVGFDRVLFRCAWTEEVVTLLKIVGTIFANALDRKRAEQERERLMKTLAAKNEELQSIVYIASHDLKSPLINIQGFSDELARTCDRLGALVGDSGVPDSVRMQFGGLLLHDIPESLRFIRAGAAKMQSLLNGLLMVSRAGSVAMDIRRIEMNAMMRQIIAAMQYQITNCGAEVTVDDLPDCLGDSDQLNQVFSNLLSNAVKYLQPGRRGYIRITGALDGGQAVYCLEDNGRGIAPQHAGKVFEIFHRLGPQDSAGGEGLGLTIARRIVERHDVRIWLESEAGKGTNFFVSLPAA